MAIASRKQELEDLRRYKKTREERLARMKRRWARVDQVMRPKLERFEMLAGAASHLEHRDAATQKLMLKFKQSIADFFRRFKPDPDCLID